MVKDKWLSTAAIQTIAEKMKTQSADEFISSFNFVNKFMVCGSFGCKACENFGQIFPPEEKIEFPANYTTKYGEISWKKIDIDPQTGYLDFLKHFKPTEWVCAYAYCKIITANSVKAQIRLGTNDMGALWLNGTQVLSQNIERTAVLDDDILPVQLQTGENTLLIKVCNTEGNWGLYLRITDPEGNALPGLSYWPR